MTDAMQWRPISEAPIHSEAIERGPYIKVLACLGDWIDTGYLWRTRSGTIELINSLAESEGIGAMINPTHWMPLPEPPKEAIDAEMETRSNAGHIQS